MSAEPVHGVRFPLGRTVITRGALDALDSEEVRVAMGRHVRGDWGDLCEEDRQANDAALRIGTRLLSAYHAQDGRKFWIITEANRSVTTVLLPEEY